MHRKSYSKAGLEPQATQKPARSHTWWSSLDRPPKGYILPVLLLSHLSVQHWKVYTESRAYTRCLPVAKEPM